MSVRLMPSGGSGKVKVAQVNGLTVTVGFSTAGTMLCEWVNPDDVNLMGVMVRYSCTDYPKSETDGTLAYDSNLGVIAEACTITGLTDGTTYYVSAFAYTILGTAKIYNLSLTDQNQGSGIPLQVQGQMIFTASGIYTLPSHISSIDVFVVGGGGGGGNGGAGGGGGYTKTVSGLPITRDTVLTIVIGAGGLGYRWGEYLQYPTAGSSTSITDGIFNVTVGGGAGVQTSANGGTGGSGGGGVGVSNASGKINGGGGGADGGSGSGGGTIGSVTAGSGGGGQGTTTRAFGKTGNTLYAGGGGGGGGGYRTNSSAGNGSSGSGGGEGGGGHGGNGASITYYHSNPDYMTGSNGGNGSYGTPNTGGGGGGTGTGSYISTFQAGFGGNGGSGIVIIRWGY